MSRFVIVALALTLATPAWAWNTATQSSNVAQALGSDTAPAAAASSAARSQSRASANLRNSVHTSATGGTATNTVQVTTGDGGSGNNARQPIASAYAPTLMPAVQCGGTTSSGGLGTTLFNFNFGRGEMDRMCQIVNYMHDPLTFFYACRVWDNDFHKAALDAYHLKLIAHPCPSDEPKAEPVATSSNVTETIVRSGPPDVCYTASPGDGQQYLRCKKIYHTTSTQRR